MDILIIIGLLLALVVVFKVMKGCLPLIIFGVIAVVLSMVLGPILGIIIAVIVMAIWRSKSD